MQEAQLHTDGLELKYGPVTSVVHEHDGARRVIDIVDAAGISRTHAITWFPQNIDDDIPQIREEVACGALVGKTFRKYGFGIEKETLLYGVIAIPDWLQSKFTIKDELAYISIYEFWGVKEGQRVLYGIVTEIYSPDFMPVTEAVYGLHELHESNAIDINDLPTLLFEYLNSSTSQLEL